MAKKENNMDQPKFIQRECYKHGMTEHVLQNRGYYRCKKCRSGHVQKRRKNLKKLAVEYKGGKCEKCGYNKCNRALEFHHTSPNEKDFTISRYSVLSWSKIKVELDKCILICANCHRELHDDEYLNNRDVFPLSDKQ